MGWAKLADEFADHPKIDPLADGAFRLHVSAICFAARTLSDGFIPAERVPRLVPRWKPTYLAELVNSGLWHEVPGGYMIHDYLHFNPSAADELQRRERDRQRKARHRQRGGEQVDRGQDGRWESRRDTPPDDPPESAEESSATRPVPSRPSVGTSPPPPTFAAPDGAEEDRSPQRLKALAEASLARFEATGGQIHTSREGWLRTERKRRMDENDWSEPEPMPAPMPASEHPVEVSQRAQQQLAARHAYPCAECGGSCNVLDDDGLAKPCEACAGTGRAA